MNLLLILIPLSLVLVIAAVWAYLWAVSSGQFDDLETPGWEILSDIEHDDKESIATGKSWPQS
jgi:cbb3-type cytochrome oxidase maturation protein